MSTEQDTTITSVDLRMGGDSVLTLALEHAVEGANGHQIAQLRKDVAKLYTERHKAGEWTENWDTYRPMDRWLHDRDRSDPRLIRTKCGNLMHAMNWAEREVARFHDVGTSCVESWLQGQLGWYKGSKSRHWSGKGQAYPARSMIRYWAFSGDYGSRPNRVNLARRVERLHWLAGLEPPEWEMLRNKEACVKRIERFRNSHGEDFKMANGARFIPSLWGNTPATRDLRHYRERPPCHACAVVGSGVHCDRANKLQDALQQAREQRQKDLDLLTE